MHVSTRGCLRSCRVKDSGELLCQDRAPFLYLHWCGISALLCGHASLCICVQVNVAALSKEVVVFFGVYLGRLFEDLGCAFADQGVDDKRHD